MIRPFRLPDPPSSRTEAYPTGTLALRGEQILNGTVEDTGETKRQGQRGIKTPLLNGNDRLPGHPQQLREPDLRPTPL